MVPPSLASAEEKGLLLRVDGCLIVDLSVGDPGRRAPLENVQLFLRRQQGDSSDLDNSHKCKQGIFEVSTQTELTSELASRRLRLRAGESYLLET